MSFIPTNSDSSHEFCDITSNLVSLQFENALFPEEIQLLHLRKRSHMMTVSACAQATYFVSVLNETRHIKHQLKNPDVNRASRLIADGGDRDNLVIGIIGCGRLGSHLAHCLLTFAEMSPDNILISTRRPETLVELQEKGVLCTSDNAYVASKCQLLFLCVLPCQLGQVAKDIRSHLTINLIIFSLIAAVPTQRIKQLTGCPNVIRPEFELGKDEDPRTGTNHQWDCSVAVTGIFARPDMLAKTCPLYSRKNECVVSTKEKFVEHIVYALVNLCNYIKLPRTDTVDLLNAVLFGHSNKNPLKVKLEQEDIAKHIPENSSVFPTFDLATLTQSDTPLTNKINHNKSLKEDFTRQYCVIFEQYLDWRNTSLQQARKQKTLN